MAEAADRTEAAPRFVAPGLVATDAAGAARLIGGRCRACQALSFPRAAVCTDCLSEDIEAVDLGTEGTLYSYSVVHQAPKGWRVPYAVGYVDLPGDVRVFAHLDAPHDALAIDMKMTLATAVVADDPAGAPLSSYVFKPA
ncbi:MAG TPA: OB-fold domain-containing protein [Pseudolabrys sp.]|nr:OB-fold domain-containing protein [Pseudolabrys sp.]